MALSSMPAARVLALAAALGSRAEGAAIGAARFELSPKASTSGGGAVML